MLGIENILQLTAAVGQCGTLGYAVMEDNKISFRDLGELRTAFKIIKQFAVIDYKSLMPEVKDLTEAELAALSACFNENLKIGGGTTEESVEAGFMVLLQLFEMLSAFSQWGKKTHA